MAGSTRSGKYFVAYRGRDISKSEIVECLESKNRSSDFDVKVVDEGNFSSCCSNKINKR